jgi:hypothetical protein
MHFPSAPWRILVLVAFLAAALVVAALTQR